jgi:ribose 5-phosphate isomerase A
MIDKPERTARGAHTKLGEKFAPAALCAIQADDRGMPDLDSLKKMAAESAVTQVSSGMLVGLGTGTTGEFVLLALARRISEGLRIQGVPTSERTAARARELGIPLTDLNGPVDIAIDGADEVTRDSLQLIKGRGGALLREKIVAQASLRFLVVVDQTKLVDRLGTAPVPVEVVHFGWQSTARQITDLGGKVQRRDFITDNGNYILDCAFDPIQAPETLAIALNGIAGVVEHGLFIDLTSEVHIGTPAGIEILRA